ncbi:myosin [Arabidopsis thaliana]|uniref:Myosin n=2 Tax=Arabidopsis thaliana TaxID=3702 RepID=A0A1P8BCE2_ARATH|nr:myosin [Arabidopsis thaliana]ANM69240.1 myosin [Arabidopsis thaliana]|eukprot:NP_001330937.1 myosin [Arabidopsis thaliana]
MSQDLEPFTEAVTRILQEALHAMCLLAEEAKADVIREQETARKAIEEAPQVIKENSEDTEKFNSLTSEVEALKASLQSERQAAEDLRNAFSEAEARNSELATNLENVTRRVDQLCESASLQSEQQAAEDLRKALSLAEARNLELTTKLENVTRRVDQLCESESQEVLVKCISQNLGYDGGKPVAACVIYKCLLHWRSFEVERTNIFDRIVKIIASAIEVSDSYKVSDNNEVLAYWLSNSAMLVCVLQRTFRSSTMLSSKGLMSGVLVSYLDRQSQVVPKCPAMLFKKQLIDFLQKIYGMMRDNLKKEILPHLEYCKQAPWPFSNPKERIVHWQRIVGSLRSYLNIMKANNVSLRIR